MEIIDLMEEALFGAHTVRIVSKSGKEYVGETIGYVQPGDEDDGFATITVLTKDKGGWCLSENEIKTIEILSQD